MAHFICSSVDLVPYKPNPVPYSEIIFPEQCKPAAIK